MDIGFLRALSAVQSWDDPLCILTVDDSIYLCSDLAQQYDDIRDVASDVFVTGFQNASGLSGQWYQWNNLKTFPSEHTETWEPSQNISPQMWESTLESVEFIDAVNSMKNHMRAGVYFLANLTRMTYRNSSVDPWTAAAYSCISHRTPFRFFLFTPELSLLGLSPERFLSISDRQVTCEPMKGTGTDEHELLDDMKEHDENTMMIDLVRADLSRICTPGSVRLEKRSHITHHGGLVQMSSIVTGQCDIPVHEAIPQLMPIASVTGTPKPYVTRHMHEHEGYEREIYCGTYGWVNTATQQCDLAVTIRSLEITPSRVSIGTGAGITLASDADNEWRETELKQQSISHIVSATTPSNEEGVFTSFAIDEEGIPYCLNEHIERVHAQARLIGQDISWKKIHDECISYIERNALHNVRLRIQISTEGSLSFSHEQLPPSTPSILGLAYAPGLTPSIKYADRKMYSSALHVAQATSALPIDDAFLVVGGLVTETTRANIFLRHGDSVSTPQRGLLFEGVMRGRVLEHFSHTSRPVRERAITLDHLLSADEIITVNSVRGAGQVSQFSHLAWGTRTFDSHRSDLFDEIAHVFYDGFTPDEGESHHPQ